MRGRRERGRGSCPPRKGRGPPRAASWELGGKEAEGRIPGECDFQQQPAKEPENQKFSKIRGTRDSITETTATSAGGITERHGKTQVGPGSQHLSEPYRWPL